MSEDEDTTVLLNNGNRKKQPKIQAISPPTQEYQYITTKNIKKIKHTNNKLPVISENQNFLIPVVATLAGISFGYDMGVGGQIAPSVKDYFELDCREENIVVNVWFIGCLIGVMFGGMLIDTCGRRWTMIFSLIFLSFGSLLSSFSNHYVLFLIARIICGYSGTMSAMSHCIYMSEVSKSEKRGCNVTLHQMGTSIGLLLSIILSIKNTQDQWRYTVGATSVISFLTCVIIIICLQRSPSFMLLKRVSNVPRMPVKNSWRYVFETLIIMMVMIILRQATGRQHVLYYAPRLFALLGICSNIAKVTATISLEIVRIFSTILCLIVAERCGRRTALITSATICMTSISLLSLLSTLDRGDELLVFPNEPCNAIKTSNIENDYLNNIRYISPTGSPPPYPLLPTPLALSAPNTESWTQVKASCETQNIITSDGSLSGGLQILAIITLLVYEAAYSLGLGPIPLLTLSEVFPAAIRGKCISVSVIVLWIVHIILYETIGKVTRIMTLPGMYLFYSFMCLLTIIYVFLVYPETKGKTLNRVAQELRKFTIANRVCNNIKSLPLVCHFKWVKKLIKLGEKANQSTPI